MTQPTLSDHRILVTGATGQVGFPIAAALARDNRVFGLARLTREADRGRLEAARIEPVAADLAHGDLSVIPSQVDIVLHFAVAKTNDFDADLAANAEGTGRLMSHCAAARAFLHCSSTAVYQPAGHAPRAESDPLGDNHRVLMPTYSLCKIAAEATARFCARQFSLPTVITRLSVPYGSGGGWPAFHFAMMQNQAAIPVHSERPSRYNPIHEDDLIAMLPAMLARADHPAHVINWAGSDVVSIEQWCGYLGEISGVEPRFQYTEQTLASVVADTTRMHAEVGRTQIPWKLGLRRMIETLHPDLPLRTASLD